MPIWDLRQGYIHDNNGNYGIRVNTIAQIWNLIWKFSLTLSHGERSLLHNFSIPKIRIDLSFTFSARTPYIHSIYHVVCIWNEDTVHDVLMSQLPLAHGEDK